MFLGISPTVTGQFLLISVKRHADKITNLQNFGNEPADIHICINPEIRIQIADHFWLISALVEFALFEHVTLLVC